MENSRENAGYLFAYFKGEEKGEEVVYFSFSENGLYWKDLKRKDWKLTNKSGTGGVRDPFIFKSKIDSQYYILGTDLCIASGTTWEEAQKRGSKTLLIWTSSDLIHWKQMKGYQVQTEDAGCVWAPETIYDEQRKAYLVFWASNTYSRNSEKRKQKIYCAYTKDFEHFSDEKLYMEQSYDVIDMTIVKEKGLYYRFYKNETEKYLELDCGTELNRNFKKIMSESLTNLKGVEGAIVYQLPDKKWCLMADQFEKGTGYLPLICKEIHNGEFENISISNYSLGENKKRHGSILQLTQKEVERLKNALI